MQEEEKLGFLLKKMMKKSNEIVSQNLLRDLTQSLTQWVKLLGGPPNDDKNNQELESLRNDLYSTLDMLLKVDNAAFQSGCNNLLSHLNAQLTLGVEMVTQSTVQNYVDYFSRLRQIYEWIDPFLTKYDFQDLSEQIQNINANIMSGEQNRIQQLQSEITRSAEVVKDSFNMAVVKFGEIYSSKVDESIMSSFKDIHVLVQRLEKENCINVDVVGKLDQLTGDIAQLQTCLQFKHDADFIVMNDLLEETWSIIFATMNKTKCAMSAK